MHETRTTGKERIDVTGGEILVLGASTAAKGYVDDLTGLALDSTLVRAAIAKGLDYFETKEVWALVPTQEARKRTGKDPIRVRLVHPDK